MRWQARKRSLRASVEEAARICRAKRWRTAFLEGLFFDQPVNFETSAHGHNKRPYRDPDAQPVKWMKLIQWWLVHRVPIDVMITPEMETAASERLKVPRGKGEEAKTRFPSLLVKVNEKRRRGSSMQSRLGRHLRSDGHRPIPEIARLKIWHPTHSFGNTRDTFLNSATVGGLSKDFGRSACSVLAWERR